MLLGVGAMVAGVESGSGGHRHRPARPPSPAPQAMIQRSLLAYVRAQEEQADRAGVKFLTATGQSPKGMYDTFKRFADQILFSRATSIPTCRPTRCRPSASPRSRSWRGPAPIGTRRTPPELQPRHDLMRAKLFGFMDRPDTVARRYPPSDTSLPARYARAISAYRFSDLRNGAIAQIDALIQAQPHNPYFHELKGQALLEGGKPAEAIAPLRRAVPLAPNPALIQIMLGAGADRDQRPAHADEAMTLLRAPR